MAVNAEDGWLWMVEEGLFIQRPTVLQAFAEEHDVERADVEQALQNRSILLMNTRPTPTPVVHYEVTLDGQRSEIMKGHVLINPEDVLGVELPGVCERIERVPSREGYW